MTLADRLNKIIEQQGVSKTEFARRIGVSPNYLYVLTGQSRADTNKNKHISPSLAKLISLEFGCDEHWILTGENAPK